MGAKKLNTYSLQTYIELEASSDTKYEYHDGLIIAMAGGSPRHGALAANMIAGVHAALRKDKKSCQIFTGDVKISIKTANKRFYPDLSVVCGPVKSDDREPQAITNPILIVEVLSPTTETQDRGNKFDAYRRLPSLMDYVLVNQDQPLVEVFSRQGIDTWRIQSMPDLASSIELLGLEITLPLSEIYFGIEW